MSERLPRRWQHGPGDIFALVKHQMCDQELSQPPLLVLPGCKQAEVAQFWQRAVRDPGLRKEVDPERAKDLKEFCEVLATYPQYDRAVHYLRGLAGLEPRPRFEAQALTFLRDGRREQPGLVLGLPKRPKPQEPHALRVRFHRG